MIGSCMLKYFVQPYLNSQNEFFCGFVIPCVADQKSPSLVRWREVLIPYCGICLEVPIPCAVAKSPHTLLWDLPGSPHPLCGGEKSSYLTVGFAWKSPSLVRWRKVVIPYCRICLEVPIPFAVARSPHTLLWDLPGKVNYGLSGH